MLTWILLVVLVLAGVLLLFPLRVYADFQVTMKECFLKLAFFKWKKEFRHVFKKKEKVEVARHKAEKKEAKALAKKEKALKKEKAKQEKELKKERASAPAEVSKIEASSVKTVETAKVEPVTPLAQEPAQKIEKKPAELSTAERLGDAKQENGKEEELSDRDFFTLLLQPKMVSLAWKYLKVLLGRTLKLFRIKFHDSFIEGVKGRSPQETGCLAALLGSLHTVFPALAGFTFVMNWDGSVELGAYGKFTAQINLLRILLFILLAAYIAGRVALLYFLMKRKYKKDATGFKLAWWRRKIVDFIAAED